MVIYRIRKNTYNTIQCKNAKEEKQLYGYQKQFIRYVSQNMLGMLGMSLYILADTYFISKAVGADGITALNLVLPVYNLIFAIEL